MTYEMQGTGGGLPAASSDERTMAMIAHLGSIVFGFLAPLVVMLTKGKESAYVRDQAVESLNFQITAAIAMFASAILMIVLIGLLLLPVVLIAWFALTILAGVKANQGEPYRYPVSLRLVK